jgi:hypothetical protein
MAHAGLVSWIDKQADWVKDALRRHALLPNHELDVAAKSEIMRRVRASCDIPQDGDCTVAPIEAAHLDPHEGGTPGALFVALGPVKNVARLAEGQRLSFALNGITLVYGDNGTGKSGYCRIAKKLCRSLTKEDLIGDVTVAGNKPPAQAQVDHRARDQQEPTSVTWTDGTTTPPEIASISVFDSRNARLYVDRENKIGFLPREVAILEHFAKNCGEMETAFDAELKAIMTRIKVPLPAGYAEGGEIAMLLQSLALKAVLPAKNTLEAAARWEASDEARLAELSAQLAQDPKIIAASKRRLVAALRDQATKLSEADAKYSAVVLDEIIALANNTAEAERMALAAAETLFGDTPLPYVGHEPWRAMYRYAEAYVVAAGFAEHLPHLVGEPCALCQQPLSEDAATRMTRFREFMTDAAASHAAAVRDSYNARRQELEAFVLEAPGQAIGALAELKASGQEGADVTLAAARWYLAMRSRRSSIIAAMKSGDFSDVAALPEAISDQMTGLANRLEPEAAALELAAEGNAEALSALREKVSALRDRQKLSLDLATVLARLEDLENAAKLSKCKEAVSTRAASLQITALRKDLVSADLEGRIKTELEEFDLLHLPFKVTDRSEGGQSNFRVAIDTPVSVPNEKVLSEGEQRALALACFLGELGADDQANGIIVDDPVSSLDHIRIRRVARRLVKEAATGRQVILFTHNLLFYSEIVTAAASHEPPIPIARRVVNKTSEAGFGVISNDDEPWIAAPVKGRVTRLRATLKQIEQRKDIGTDSYRSAAKDFYTDLRETWERLVEELLLGKVVERFNTDVRTQSLKLVQVDDDDYATIYWAMKAVSERSGHDTAAGKQIGDPTYAEMKSHLDALDDYRIKIDKRSVENGKRRKEFEKPPKAETA